MCIFRLFITGGLRGAGVLLSSGLFNEERRGMVLSSYKGAKLYYKSPPSKRSLPLFIHVLLTYYRECGT